MTIGITHRAPIMKNFSSDDDGESEEEVRGLASRLRLHDERLYYCLQYIVVVSFSMRKRF